MTRIAILGPGLLGGSVALGMARQQNVEIRMWGRRPEILQQALDQGIAAFVSGEVTEVVRDAECVVLCVPVGAMEGLVREALPALAPDALVTDVGSVKKSVVETLAPMLEGKALFVGSHPMAGSEKAGLAAAKHDLFKGAVCILTPEPYRTAPAAVLRASQLWTSLGCSVRQLAPDIHDQVCAQISHVPHVVAAALVNSVTQALPESFGFCGPGFRDTTRVASGLPAMWSEILNDNRESVASGLRGVVAQLEEIISILERNEGSATEQLNAFLSAAKLQRDRLQLT